MKKSILLFVMMAACVVPLLADEKKDVPGAFCRFPGDALFPGRSGPLGSWSSNSPLDPQILWVFPYNLPTGLDEIFRIPKGRFNHRQGFCPFLI